MRKPKIFYCDGCSKPYHYGDEATGSFYSECTCKDGKVKCDDCGEMKTHAEMDMENMFLSLCKVCNCSNPVILGI